MDLELRIQAGEIVTTPEQRRALEELMRQAFGDRRREEIQALAQAITEPIRVISEYRAAFDDVLVTRDIQPGEDARVPLEQYDVIAWETGPRGTPMAVQVGLTWKQITPVFVETGFEITRLQRLVIPWDEVARKTQRAGEELARKRDKLTVNTLLAAANSVGHVVNVTGGVLTRSAVEQVFKDAARIGYKITRVKVNSADVLAMRSGGNGWAADPFRVTDSALGNRLLREGFLGEYGGAEWQATPSVPGHITGTQDGLVFFLADPDMLGYRLYWERVRPRVFEDVVHDTARYFFREVFGQLVVNPYAVWVIKLVA
jgi:hypothetical protein